MYILTLPCWLRERSADGEQINVDVPTGNFGNILAAYYAKQMGVPIAKLICASMRIKYFLILQHRLL